MKARLTHSKPPTRRGSDPNQRLIHVDQLEDYLRVLRDPFGDTATLYDPWGHPDD